MGHGAAPGRARDRGVSDGYNGPAMRGTLALVVAALAVGVGVGYLLAARGRVPERAARPAAKPVREPAQGPPRTATTLTEAVRAIRAPAPVTGTGTIRGRVGTVDGEEVPGALVVATPRREYSRSSYRRGRGAPERPSLEESVRTFVEQYQWTEALRREARTSSDGGYVVAEVPDGKYQLSAYAEGYVLRAKRGHKTWDVEPGAVVDFIATAVFDLTVDVFLPNGSRATEAAIRWKGERHVGREEWTAAEPTIQLNAGDYELFAVAGENEDLKSEPQSIKLATGKAPPNLVFRLHGRPGIRGRVIVPDDLELRDVYVYAQRFVKETAPEELQLRRSNRYVRAQAGEDYRFEHKDLAPGRYLLAVSVDREVAEATEVVEVTDFMVEKDIRLSSPDPERHIAVLVFGPDGKPLTGLRFMCHYETKSFSGSGPATAFPMADGSYRVRLRDWVAQGADEGGKHVLYVNTRKYGRIEREVDPAARRDVISHIAETARLDIVIEGYVGSGLEGKILLDLKAAPEKSWGHYSPRRGVNEKGEFSFGSVQPGAYVLVLIRNDGGHYPIARVPLQLTKGEHRIPVPMPPLYTLRVVPRVPQDNWRLGLQVIDEGGQRVLQYERQNKQGHVVFEFVPAGRYEISGRYEGELRKVLVEVPAQSEVRFP